MFHVMLSYPLFGEGMRILENKTDLFVSNDGDLKPYLEQLGKADAFITRNVHPTKDILDRCPSLKIIGIPGSGYQNYDVEDLTRRGIALLYCPNMNSLAVAEHAVGLAYALLKWIPYDDEEVKKGNYGVRNRFNHGMLSGKTAGIAGFGHIGQLTAKLFAANGCEIVIYDPFRTEEDAKKLGYGYAKTLTELAERSDILSLHMPSLPTTYHIFNEEVFSAMKKGSYFVNCARGSVVDEKALYKALEDGTVAAAGLDVMEKEPFDMDNPLVHLRNVIVTPHVAGVTKESSEAIHEKIVVTSLELLEGNEVRNIVNPDALKHPKWQGIFGGEK